LLIGEKNLRWIRVCIKKSENEYAEREGEVKLVE
jgi:hypothetical protein